MLYFKESTVITVLMYKRSSTEYTIDPTTYESIGNENGVFECTKLIKTGIYSVY